MSNFPCSLTRNIESHSMKNLTFHSLVKKNDYTNSHYLTYTFFPLKGWENVLYELRSERVNLMQQKS